MDHGFPVVHIRRKTGVDASSVHATSSGRHRISCRRPSESKGQEFEIKMTHLISPCIPLSCVGPRLALRSSYERIGNRRRFHTNPRCKSSASDIEHIEYRRDEAVAHARGSDIRSTASRWDSLRYLFSSVVNVHSRESRSNIFMIVTCVFSQGLDRLICMLCNARSIKSVIAFPKSTEGLDLMAGAPDVISDDLKTLYNIRTVDKQDVAK